MKMHLFGFTFILFLIKKECIFTDRYVQQWSLKNYDLDPWWGVFDTATYTYEYDRLSNVAIPLKYEHFYKFDTSNRTEVRTYSYTDVVDDGIFDVVRYCDGIWLYNRNLNSDGYE